MIEAAFSDGASADIGAMEPMFALIQYISERKEKYPVLAEADLLSGVVESDDFEAMLAELQSINCAGDCPIVQNLIGAFQSAIENQDEWVMFV